MLLPQFNINWANYYTFCWKSNICPIIFDGGW